MTQMQGSERLVATDGCQLGGALAFIFSVIDEASPSAEMIRRLVHHLLFGDKPARALSL